MNRRLLPLLLVGAILLIVQGGHSSPFTVQPEVRKFTLPPYRHSTLIEPFKGKERAVAILSGDGSTCLGLYIFDMNGNCVELDDQSRKATFDDVVVEWFPQQDAPYAVEPRNGGPVVNEAKMVIR
jgi:hypothetical protein